MKKYLLTALLGVFGLFGFTSAYTVSCTVNEDGDCAYGGDFYEYFVYGFTPGDNINFSNIVGSCSYEIQFYDESMEHFESYEFSSNSNYLIPSYTEVIQITPANGTPLETCSFDYTLTSSSSGGGSDSSDSSGLLSGGTAVFGGIISSLGSAVSEFIPYVAYIGLGLLGAIIGFVAIKRLLNRIRAKIFGTFSGGRRK